MPTPQTLYIIGNGFDMYHGLYTDYKSFASFLVKENYDLYNSLIKYFGFRDLFSQYFNNDKVHTYNEWNKFEEALSKINLEDILEDFSNYVADLSSDPEDQNAFEIQLGDLVENLTQDLCETFRKFILAIQWPISIADRVLYLEANCLFLNFNFTDTIERFYTKLSSVLHVHGLAKSNEPIILGHAINPKNFNLKTNKTS